MKHLENYEGFKKAMKAGKTWVTLDCSISKCHDGTEYYEIDKAVFRGDKDRPGHDSHERLAYGHGFEECEKIWDNLIKEHRADEYFVEKYGNEVGGEGCDADGDYS